LSGREVMRLRGKPEQALAYLESQESLNPPDGQDIESQTRLHMHRGYHLGLMARYQGAHRLLAEAEAVSRITGLIELRAEVCLRQAMILFLQKDYTASDRTYRTVLERSDELGGWCFRATALWGIGKNLMIQRHYEEATPWLEEALEMFEGAGARISTATVWGELGVCRLGLGDDAKALDLFSKVSGDR
jgi:tetratricopeptide (TPR) repeat protein